MNQKGDEYKIVDHFVITQQILGRGAFGTVYRGYKKDNPSEIVAVKVIPISIVNKNKNFTKLLKRELDILPKIDNPYITKLTFQTASCIKNRKQLLHVLGVLQRRRPQDLAFLEAIPLRIRVAHLLQAHRRRIQGHLPGERYSQGHKTCQHSPPQQYSTSELTDFLDKAKISDFGFARVVDDMEESDIFTLLGTPLYMSPQILEAGKFSSKADIWSLGMLFYEMLYGKTPWNANSQQNLQKAIKSQQLCFPANPQRSQKIKDLISRMLSNKEEERISWPEIFNHELVKENEAVLEKQMQDIKSSQLDDLEKSCQLNQLYIDKNKVIIQGEMNIQIQNFFLQNNQNQEASSDPNSIQNSQDQEQEAPINQNMEYKQILEAQNQQLRERETTLRIDQYLSLKRNTGIFVNFTTNSIFKLFKDGVIKFPYHLFYRIIFLLQKHQMIIFQELIDIMASKVTHRFLYQQVQIQNGINQKDWKNYRNSQEYFTTLQSIKSDNAYIKPYFTEIFQRTQDYLASVKANQEEAKEIKEFLSVLTKEFKIDIQFRAIYEKTLKQVLKVFSQYLQTDQAFKESKLGLQTAKFLKICVDPQSYFKWNSFSLNGNTNQNQKPMEFNKFYEDYENLSLHSLLMEVKEDFNDI